MDKIRFGSAPLEDFDADAKARNEANNKAQIRLLEATLKDLKAAQQAAKAGKK